MNIVGEKVIMRAIEVKDNDMLLSMCNDPDIEFMLGGWSFPVSTQNQAQWTDSLKYTTNTLRCVIETKQNQQAIGVVMLTDIDYKNGNAEIHVKLANSDCRGKGYGTDAVQTIVDYAFNELRLHLVYAKISFHNEPSKRLFEKCHFQDEGILRDRYYKGGKFISVMCYSITSGEQKNERNRKRILEYPNEYK